MTRRTNKFGSEPAGSAATSIAPSPVSPAPSTASPAATRRHRAASAQRAAHLTELAATARTPDEGPCSAESPRSIDGVVIATLLALRSDGKALVQVLDPTGLDARLGQPIFATHVTTLTTRHIGRRVALLFEQGDPGKPIIMAAMHEVQPQAPGDPDVPRRAPVTVELDGDELHLDARRELILSCGKASITLTRAGKIIMHGTYVVSRSSGVNRIKGGSVQIN